MTPFETPTPTPTPTPSPTPTPTPSPTPTPTPTPSPSASPSPSPSQSPGPAGGCTPGFWKTHPELWDGVGSDSLVSGTYLIGTDFDTVFGRNQFDPDITLLDALGLNGGGALALARHATAALLNADSDMTFAYSVAQVIAIYRDAMDGVTDIEAAHIQLANENERGCPFDHDDDWRLNWHEPPGCDHNPDCDSDSVSDGLNDADGPGPIVVGPDNCVVSPNAGQANWDSDPLGDVCDDGDGDGFLDSAELHVGTGPAIPCGLTGWPADLHSSGLSANKITIQDILTFVAPVRHFNTSPGDFGFDQRWDLQPAVSVVPKQINVQDILEIVVIRPPMLGGAGAMGATCPNP